MDDSRNLDADQMMEKMRLKVHSQGQQGEARPAHPKEPPQRASLEQQLDMTTLHANYDISATPMELKRKVLGRVMKRAVNLVYELLWPTLRRQSEYNAANTRLTDFLKHQGEWLVSDYVEFRDHTERTLDGDRAQFKAQLEAAYQRFAKLYADDSTMRSRTLDELAQRVAAGERLDRDYQRQLQNLETLERRQAELRLELESCSGTIRDLIQQIETLTLQHQTLAALNQGLEEHASRLDTMDTQQAQLTQSLERLHQAQSKEVCAQKEELQSLHQTQVKFESEVRAVNSDFQAMRMRLLQAERRLRRIAAIDNGNAGPLAAEPSAPPLDAAEIDYAGFEDLLRNSAQIKTKQRGYLTYFTGKGAVIDVGCGRGEFLELMREAGIEAKGLDLDFDMTLICKEKGLDVTHCDALSYLADVPDGSIGGIFSAQVIEHLTSAQLNTLIALASRKLRPGGSLVLETLNPESLFVHYKWFWMDPSHVRLTHPQTLKFLLESAGFSEVSYSLCSPPAGVLPIPQLQSSTISPLDDFNRATDYLNKLIYGEQEYFVTGRK